MRSPRSAGTGSKCWSWTTGRTAGRRCDAARVGTRCCAAAAAGPAAARNVGWRAAADGWVAFLDDDVLPDPDWVRRLAADVEVPARVGGVQGRVRVPLPAGRRPTDWERVTAGLASGRWITADMAYRRAALAGRGRLRRAVPAGVPGGRRGGLPGAGGRVGAGRRRAGGGPPGTAGEPAG